MIGAYIASITAFLVVNNTILPGVVAWLLPTAVLVPVLIKWSRKYAVKIVKK
jgi:type IV secretory pathway component VirB8